MRLGRYEILTRLGGGGMADVWIARATGVGAFERRLAMKTVHAELARDPRQRELFVREARIAATIRHANVVDIFDFGEEDGVLFQVMSLVEGGDLSRLMKRARERTTSRRPGALPFDVIATIMTDALRGLHAAHESKDEQGRQRELVHRDVSPQNVLVGLDGISRVSDFGIAVEFAADAEATGTLRGKFGYFAPERLEPGPIDRRVDVFAMGVVLWEALTSRRLFRASNQIELIAAVRSMPIPDPRSVYDDVPAGLAAVALKALERDKALRFATAAEMGSAILEACRSDGIVPSVDAVAQLATEEFGEEVRARAAAASAAPPSQPARKDGTVSWVPTPPEPDGRTEVMAEPPTDGTVALPTTTAKAAARRPPLLVAALGGGTAVVALGIAAFLWTRPPGPTPIATATSSSQIGTTAASSAPPPSAAPLASSTAPASATASAAPSTRPTAAPLRTVHAPPPTPPTRPPATASTKGHDLPFAQNPFAH
jgi:serine/threonine-protein kinase